MSRQEIFEALNEDYPIRADVSNNPIGLFETSERESEIDIADIVKQDMTINSTIETTPSNDE